MCKHTMEANLALKKSTAPAGKWMEQKGIVLTEMLPDVESQFKRVCGRVRAHVCAGVQGRVLTEFYDLANPRQMFFH